MPSERLRGARLGGKSVTDNRQGATVTIMNDADCNGSMLGRVGASDVMRNSRDGRPLPAVRYVNRLIFRLGQRTRHAPILGNNYVTARHPSLIPAIKRLSLCRTVPGRRTDTRNPPSSSAIDR